jgi:anti-sigma factor RsiW
VTCREATEFLTDYIAGDLDPAVTAVFERHISRCPNCQVFLAQFKDTVAAGSRAYDDPDLAATATMPEDLVAAILSTVRRGDA